MRSLRTLGPIMNAPGWGDWKLVRTRTSTRTRTDLKPILGKFQKSTKVEPRRISGRSKRHSLLHGKIYPLMHDSITFATPFHPKNDLENRPFRASYISTRSQRRLSGKFGHEMGGDRCRGRWITIQYYTILLLQYI